MMTTPSVVHTCDGEIHDYNLSPGQSVVSLQHFPSGMKIDRVVLTKKGKDGNYWHWCLCPHSEYKIWYEEATGGHQLHLAERTGRDGARLQVRFWRMPDYYF